MGAVLRREFSSFFKSPIGYVFLAAYYLIAGFLFYVTVASYTTQTSFIFYYLFYASCILLPILTMKLFSDEKKQKTDQLLLTTGYADKPRLRQIFCNFLHLRHRRWNHSCIFPDSCGV